MPGAAGQVTAGVQPTGRPVSGPYERRDSFCICRRGGCPHPPASLPPSRGKDDSHYQGEMSRRDKRGRGARPKVVTDEGDFLACTPPGGSPKGLPYPNAEGVLEIRRGGAEGESAEGREKPPRGVSLRFSRRARCPHRAVPGPSGVPPLPMGERNLIPYLARATARVAPTSTCLKPDGRVRTPAPTANKEAGTFFA